MTVTAAREYRDTIDKTNWPRGPWNDEPDKVQWVDATTDLDCLAVRNHYGAWCGYVGVPPGHPLHGEDYDEVAVDVHGGLTFADSCDEAAPEGRGICHVPLPGRPPDVWWLGFDCGHLGDTSPGMGADLGGLGISMPTFGVTETYRTLDYVQGEVARLAAQVAEVSR